MSSFNDSHIGGIAEVLLYSGKKARCVPKTRKNEICTASISEVFQQRWCTALSVYG